MNEAIQPGSGKVLSAGERLAGDRVSLRLVTLDDCGDEYVRWLQDPEVNRYLETRWKEQSLESIRSFVKGMAESRENYLLAIVENSSQAHIGNLKIGPINAAHSFADLSYFVGERSAWGRGYATDAIRVATRFAFRKLGLRRLQAGLYEGNKGSARALEKAGYLFEARFVGQLRGPGGWEDHLWYVATADRWNTGSVG